MTVRSVRVDDAALERAVRSSRTLEQALQPVAAKATRLCKDVAAERVRSRTGRYLAGFRSKTVRGGESRVVARIRTENPVEYAPIIEGGSRPHVILPRRARVLVFEAGGQTVFAARVNHPGTRPQRIIEVALKRLAGGR